MADGDLRLQGVYEQAREGLFMIRAKVAGGALSAEQADRAGRLAERFAGGTVHLTTRMSLELHGVRGGDLAEALEGLRSAGLATRGACGAAVRGVAVSTPFSAGHAHARAAAARLQDRFTGNPAYEGLPRKFKIGVDGGYDGARHLIQDVGLVWVGEEAGQARYDAWLAGGLGREPAEAFLFERGVPERRALPLAEAAVRVHREHTPPGRRLRHLAAERGREWLRGRVALEWAQIADLPGAQDGPDAGRLPSLGAPAAWVTARVFAGDLAVGALRRLAEASRAWAGGVLFLTPDQDAALRLVDPAHREDAEAAVGSAGLEVAAPGGSPRLRVCPGSHECRLGLAPTRDVARTLLAAMGERARRLEWAVSGCPNGCAQPQLAQAGVVCRRLHRGEGGGRQPRFTLLRREGPGFGREVRGDLSLTELEEAVRHLG